MPTIDVVIPALNEEAALPLVLKELSCAALQAAGVRRIVVADNGSTDGTAAVAKHHGAIVVSEPCRGYGAACLKALAHLEDDPPDIVAFIDGDFSDDPRELPYLLAPIISGDAQLVVGSRTLGNRERGSLTAAQVTGNMLACTLLRALYGARYTDLGPFRAIRWKALHALGMRDRNFGWTVEMQIKAAQRGIKYAEVPVSYRNRYAGQSKVSGNLIASARAGHVILSTLLKSWRHSP